VNPKQQQQATIDEQVKKKHSSNQQTMYVDSTMTKLHSKARRRMKHTMPIQLVLHNNIVQIHCNIVWKFSRKNVLREAYLDKHLRLPGFLRASGMQTFKLSVLFENLESCKHLSC
jgi:hypothetical protein